MNIERRLQHAARDLREVEIAVPPLGERTRRQPRRPRRLQALAVPVLFVVGGLFAISGVRATTPEPVPLDSDIPIQQVEPASIEQAPNSGPPALAPPTATTGRTAPSVHAELEMIAEVISSRKAAVASDDDAASTSDGDVLQTVVTFGPI